MTLARRLEHRRVWKCDACGKEDIWQKDWAWYGSLLDEETCHNDLLTACSNECMKVIDEKVKNGDFVLPKIKRTGHSAVITKDRVGY